MIVTAFVDETGIDGPRVMLAAYIARLRDWHVFRNKWNKLLRDEKIPYSHVTEMRHGKPPFEGWNDAKIESFRANAAKIIRRHCAFGITAAVDKERRESYAAGMPPKTSPDSAYGMCARQFFEQMRFSLNGKWDCATCG